MLERLDVMSNPEVKEALKDGYANFREKVVQRILAEDKERVFIHRCLKCHRIVRTPKAR